VKYTISAANIIGPLPDATHVHSLYWLYIVGSQERKLCNDNWTLRAVARVVLQFRQIRPGPRSV